MPPLAGKCLESAGWRILSEDMAIITTKQQGILYVHFCVDNHHLRMQLESFMR